MNQAVQIINKILPIILLLLTGKWIQTRKLISESSVADIKKIVVNLALPAVLFLSFLNVELRPSYIWFIPVMMGYCVLLYFLGIFIHKHSKIDGHYFPFLITGFEYGMMGVSLFGAAYGLGHIGKFAVVDFGQEMFIWFIYTALLVQKRDGSTQLVKLFKMFATSPVIIALFAGVLLNIMGIPDKIDAVPGTAGILSAIDLIGSLTIPLILLVVGYGIQLDWWELFYSARVILIRFAVNIPAALFLNHFLIEKLMGLDQVFKAGLFTLLILPPPYILSLYMKQDLKEELHRVNNTLTLHTIATILIFIIYYAFNPVI